MNMTETKKVVELCFRTKTPCLLHGAPGVGKTSVCRQVAEEHGVAFLPFHLYAYEAIDFRGKPEVVDGRLRWVPPEELPTDGEGILCLEEIAYCEDSVQAVAMQLALERSIASGYRLPDGWRVVACTNRITDRAGVRRLLSPVQNRFAHVTDVMPTVEEWREYAIGAGFHELVVGYVTWRPEHLMTFDPAKLEPAFATPRSWEICSRLLYAGAEPRLAAEVSVGPGVAQEFVAWADIYRSVPTATEILADPDGIPLPLEEENPALLVALVNSVVCYVAARCDEPTARRALRFARRLPDEYRLVALREFLRIQPERFARKKEVLEMLRQYPELMRGRKLLGLEDEDEPFVVYRARS